MYHLNSKIDKVKNSLVVFKYISHLYADLRVNDMSVSKLIDNLIFEYPEENEFEDLLLGNEQAVLNIYSVTFNMKILAIPPTGEWTQEKIFQTIREYMPLIASVGRVEISLDSCCIGMTSTYRNSVG